MTVDTEQRQDGDSRRAHRLHEAERRQPKRDDVEHPPSGLGREANDPVAAPEQHAHRPDRLSEAESRQCRGSPVLLGIGPVDGQRRNQRKAQAYPDVRDLLLQGAIASRAPERTAHNVAAGNN